LEVDTVVQTSRLDALTLVLQGPGLLDVGHGWYLISEVMFFGVGVQDAKLMAEHFEFHLDVGAILLREQGSQLRLDLSLLVEQVLDGRIQRGIMVGREGRG
jgi:hypothetical protein